MRLSAHRPAISRETAQLLKLDQAKEAAEAKARRDAMERARRRDLDAARMQEAVQRAKDQNTIINLGTGFASSHTLNIT